MPATTKAWVTIADSAIDPDSPLDTTLMTALRDDLIHLREWLGASYPAGAVQDHDHDGSNSKLIEIGPNYARNPSFETGTASWALTPFTGGSIAQTTTARGDGAGSLAVTSTVLANGGGEALQSGFTAVSGNEVYPFRVLAWGNAAGISAKAEVVWYDAAQSQISVDTIFTTTAVGTAILRRVGRFRAPSNARFCKIKLTGGMPGSGASTGTVYFDGVTMGVFGLPLIEPGNFIQARSESEVTTSSTTYTKAKDIEVPADGRVTVTFSLNGSGGGSDAYGRVYVNDVAVGTERQINSGYTAYSEDVDVTAGDNVQVWFRHAGGTAYVKDFFIKARHSGVYIVVA